ncbi:MAG TPA: hypothetical protein VF068_02500 [Rubrobacter sp.]
MEGKRHPERRSVFASTTGGVKTREAGAVTGDLELATTVEGDRLLARVRYAGANEWYEIEGSPVQIDSTGNPAEAHRLVVEHLGLPGPVTQGNEEPVSLEGFTQA